MIGIIIAGVTLYVGTTVASFKIAVNLYNGVCKYLDSKGYEFREEDETLSKKTIDLLSTLSLLLLPGYNIYKTKKLYADKEELYKGLEEKYLLSGAIYKRETEEDSDPIQDDVKVEYIGEIEVVEQEKDIIDVIMEHLDDLWQDYMKENHFGRTDEPIDVEFVDITEPSQGQANNNPTINLKKSR